MNAKPSRASFAGVDKSSIATAEVRSGPNPVAGVQAQLNDLVQQQNNELRVLSDLRDRLQAVLNGPSPANPQEKDGPVPFFPLNELPINLHLQMEHRAKVIEEIQALVGRP